MPTAQVLSRRPFYPQLGASLRSVKDLDLIVKAYDIRGTYPAQIDADTCRALGVGFAAFVRTSEPDTTEIVIARDMRPSGPELVSAFGDGVRSQGLDVIDIGMGSTDMIYFASGSLDVPGVMFTASHNPAGYNGIKLCRSGAAPIGEDSGLAAIKEVANDSAAGRVENASRFGSVRSDDLLDAFAAHVHSFVDLGTLRPLKVVASAAGRSVHRVLPKVFDGLPFDLEVMYPELDGTFPNHEANPIEPENLVDLQARVKEVGADIGLAFDGDADRVFLVDEMGEPVSGSLTTALLARVTLEAEPDASVIYNLICSKAVPEVVKENGGTAIRSRVGHSFIKQVMAETGAAFGGEHSAHYYFRDNWRADSGIIASMMVLAELSASTGTLSELMAPMDRYAASGEINTRVADAATVIEHVASVFSSSSQDRLDGLTVDAGDWWFNLRASNTEPLLRLNLEAADAAAVAVRVSEVQAVMAAV